MLTANSSEKTFKSSNWILQRKESKCATYIQKRAYYRTI
uniref:Uncharacterized protein n=1 Tax=Anguilla anguilla TaxID=7936 RepID=A0A0E9V089_ANGAN